MSKYVFFSIFTDVAIALLMSALLYTTASAPAALCLWLFTATFALYVAEAGYSRMKILGRTVMLIPAVCAGLALASFNTVHPSAHFYAGISLVFLAYVGISIYCAVSSKSYSPVMSYATIYCVVPIGLSGASWVVPYSFPLFLGLLFCSIACTLICAVHFGVIERRRQTG